MKQKNYQRWSRPLLLTLLSIFMAFSGASSAWAQTFTLYGEETAQCNQMPIYGYYNDYYTKSEFIIPASDLSSISGKELTAMTFYASQTTTPNGTYQFFLKEVNVTTLTGFLGNDGATTVYSGTVSINSSKELKITFSSAYTYQGGNLLVGCYTVTKGNNYPSNYFLAKSVTSAGWAGYNSSSLNSITGNTQAYIPRITFSYNVEGPALSVANGETTIASGYSYNFGLATAGTTKEFTLSNPGTEPAPITISHTGSFGVSPTSTSIPAGESVTLTVTMPETTGNDIVTISSTSDAIDDFVINVSGTVRDPVKLWCNFASGLPTGWTNSGNYTINTSGAGAGTSGGGYAGETSYTYKLMNTPLATFEEGEKLYLKVAGYSSSANYNELQIRYSSDGSNWTTAKTISNIAKGSWTDIEVSEIPAGNYYIGFYGRYVYFTDIYGGTESTAPVLSLSQSSYDFGLINENTTSTAITITNTGKSELTGMNLVSSNEAFTFNVTDAATAIAANGGTATFTVTMSSANAGAQNGTITIQSDNADDLVLNVSGAVAKAGTVTETFNNNQKPDRWTNSSSPTWTFADEVAYAGSTSWGDYATMTTPKITISEGDFLAIKVKLSNSGTSYGLIVKGSNDEGTTWTAFTRTINTTNDGINDLEYKTVVISGIPTSVNKLQFQGYYCYVDEIAGLTYAPVLSVTKDEAAVNTPADYDFGECAANATVTYNFANAGAGTINITGVAITGDGAAAYTTNWAESVAAPFALTITRTYDAGRAGAGAQEAVVTVTTSEGDFVINVTGTDKAANAPELSVTLGEDPVTTDAAANFGTNLKAAPAAKTYTITNSGTGTLTGTIATSDNTKFTVSKTAFSLGAAESTKFDVALVFNTTYGAKAATITIHPTNDGLNDGSYDITINASASTLDPETWTEDFEGGTLPTGWVITPGTYSGDTYAWHIGTFSSYENKTNMAVAPTSTTYNTIITPRLAAKEDDVLTWDAYFNWSDEYMTVEWSNDGTSGWTTIYNQYKPEDESISTQYYHKEMSFTAPADGNYYLRFTSRYSNGIDNFSGFKLNPKTHDAIITAKSIPATGNQYVEYTATATVNELLGKDDEVVTAELWIGTNKVATEASVTLNASASKVISLTFTPATAMSGDAYIKVYNGDNSIDLTSDVQAVTIAEALVLDETVDPAISSTGVKPSVVVKYNAKNGWNTICMPFALTDDILTSIFGTGWKAYEFKGYNSETKVLSFGAPTYSCAAGYPYIIYIETAASHPEGVKLFDVNVAALEPNNDTYSGATFQGTYAPKAAGSLTDNYGVTTEGKIVKANSSASMKGFRAYFTGLPTNATARLSFEDDATGITTIIDAKELNNDCKVYNLNGQRVENAHKGLYIVNGRKVVVK